MIESGAAALDCGLTGHDWVIENGVGVVLDNFKGIRAAAGKLVASLDQYRGAVEKIKNVDLLVWAA